MADIHNRALCCEPGTIIAVAKESEPLIPIGDLIGGMLHICYIKHQIVFFPEGFYPEVSGSKGFPLI